MSGPPFGPLDRAAWHLCIDMQRLFLEPGDWYCPAGLEILPAVRRLAMQFGERTAFTRFITAETAEQAEGRWRDYYRHWSSVTRAKIGAAPLELHESLLPLAPPGLVFDKLTHNAFDSAAFTTFVAQRRPSALVLTGVETDVCVLATALSAVDRGIRTIIVSDAVASSNAASHRACFELIYPRFDRQIELVASDALIASGGQS